MDRNQILRENALLEKQIQRQAEEMRDYASGLRDSSEFDLWRARMEAKDRAEREAEIELNKLKMRQQRQIMREAVEKLQVQKVQDAQHFQAENMQQIVELMEKQQSELEEMRDKNQ